MLKMKLLKKYKSLSAEDQGGFTLIELLVVIGLLAILLAITLIAINPNKHFEDARNAQRQSNVSEILNGIYEYEAANNGTLPPSLSAVTSTPKDLGGGGGQINVCPDLTPTYLANLPMDPDGTGSACVGSYDTGYTIAVSAGNRYTIAAPDAEDGATITVTR
jgi:prepilin-type N-terminal cleavage/methylation domain-containing protein